MASLEKVEGGVPSLCTDLSSLLGQVRDTGGSSATSKKSAAQLGYTEDRFILRLVPGTARRAPAIHR